MWPSMGKPAMHMGFFVKIEFDESMISSTMP